MTKKKKNNTSSVSKLVYLIVTLVFLIVANMYFSDLIIEELDLGLNLANPVFALRYVQNMGAAFSILKDYPYAVIGLSAGAFVFVLFYTINNIKNISMRGIFLFSLLMSGIFCNLYERIFFGYVRDFIELTFVTFSIFNFSDIAINLSVFTIIILLLNKNVLKNL